MAGSKLVQDALDLQADQQEEIAAIGDGLTAIKDAVLELCKANDALTKRIQECEGMIYTVTNQQAAVVIGTPVAGGGGGGGGGAAGPHGPGGSNGYPATGGNQTKRALRNDR